MRNVLPCLQATLEPHGGLLQSMTASGLSNMFSTMFRSRKETQYFFISHSALSPPPIASTDARNVCTAGLELFQNLRCIITIHAECVLFCATASTNFFDYVVWVCGTDDRDFRGQPLLERLCDEEAVSCKPSRHGCTDMDLLGERGARWCEDNVTFINWNVLLRMGRYSNLELLVSFVVAS